MWARGTVCVYAINVVSTLAWPIRSAVTLWGTSGGGTKNRSCGTHVALGAQRLVAIEWTSFPEQTDSPCCRQRFSIPSQLDRENR